LGALSGSGGADPAPGAAGTGYPARCSAAGRPGRPVGRVLLDTVLVVLLWAAGHNARDGLADHPAWKTPLIGLLLGGALALGLGQIVLLSRRGQTIGKLVLRIRIVGDGDESNPGFWRACVRRDVIPGLIAVIPVLGPLFALIDLLNIFGEERRCLHDLLADTKVVEV
jgi:uncharacterized RDD family membrane protein YckC